MKLALITFLIAAAAAELPPPNTSSPVLAQATVQQCPNFVPVDTTGLGNFTTVMPETTCSGILLIFDIPWPVFYHVHRVPDTEPLRIAAYPEGIVEPFVELDALKFRWGVSTRTVADLYQNYSEAGVDISVPVGQLKSIKTVAVGGTVDVVDETSGESDAISYVDAGAWNIIYIKSAGPVMYRATGLSTAIEINADSANIAMSGLDNLAKVNGDVVASISGGSNMLLVEGTALITVSGSSNDVFVNGPGQCQDFVATGLANSCMVTSETVDFTELPCLATASTFRMTCWNVGGVAVPSPGSGLIPEQEPLSVPEVPEVSSVPEVPIVPEGPGGRMLRGYK